MHRIPDRWLDYSRCGALIGRTRILACKTPLKVDFHSSQERPEGVPPDKQFTPTQLVEHFKKKGQRIGLVVDLTFSDKKYYDPKEFKSFGIKYAKVRCPVKEIPRLIYLEFAEVLQDHLALKNQDIIVVHCIRGVNQTGYLVCRFLMNHFKYSADSAIQAFNTARGHSMDKAYITSTCACWQNLRITKEVKKTTTTTSTQPKTQRSRPGATAYSKNPSSRVHSHYGAYARYPDDDVNDKYQNDYDDDDDDDEYYKHPRFKGRNYRESQDQWCDDMLDYEDNTILEDYNTYEEYFKFSWYGKKCRK